MALRNSWQKELGGFFSYRCTWYHNFNKIIGTIQSIRKAYQSRFLHLFLFFPFKDYSQASPIIPREEVSPVTAPHDQVKTRTVCLSTMVICVRSSKWVEIIDEKIMTPVLDARGSGTLFFRGLFFVHYAPGFSFLFVLSNCFFSTTQPSSVSFSRGLI